MEKALWRETERQKQARSGREAGAMWRTHWLHLQLWVSQAVGGRGEPLCAGHESQCGWEAPAKLECPRKEQFGKLKEQLGGSMKCGQAKAREQRERLGTVGGEGAGMQCSGTWPG